MNTTESISNPYHKPRTLWKTWRESELAHLWNGLTHPTERGFLVMCVRSSYETRGQRDYFYSRMSKLCYLELKET
jgi:hypothetical protein